VQDRTLPASDLSFRETCQVVLSLLFPNVGTNRPAAFADGFSDGRLRVAYAEVFVAGRLIDIESPSGELKRSNHLFHR
jgi:hypothetical protein